MRKTLSLSPEAKAKRPARPTFVKKTQSPETFVSKFCERIHRTIHIGQNKEDSKAPISSSLEGQFETSILKTLETHPCYVSLKCNFFVDSLNLELNDKALTITCSLKPTLKDNDW